MKEGVIVQKSKAEEQGVSRTLVMLTLLILSRPGVKLRERLCPGGPLVDKPFIGKLFDNIKACGYPQKLEDKLLSLVIMAVGAKGPVKRGKICDRILDEMGYPA